MIFTTQPVLFAGDPKTSVLQTAVQRASSAINKAVTSTSSSSSHSQGKQILPAAVHYEQQAQLLKARLRQRRKWRKRLQGGSSFSKTLVSKKKVSSRKGIEVPSPIKTYSYLHRRITNINDSIQAIEKTQTPNLPVGYMEGFLERYRKLLKFPKGSIKAVSQAKKLHSEIHRVYHKFYTPTAQEYNRQKNARLDSLLASLRKSMTLEQTSRKEGRAVPVQEIDSNEVLLRARQTLLDVLDKTHRDNPQAFEGPEKSWKEIRGAFEGPKPSLSLSYLYDIYGLVCGRSGMKPFATDGRVFPAEIHSQEKNNGKPARRDWDCQRRLILKSFFEAYNLKNLYLRVQ